MTRNDYQIIARALHTYKLAEDKEYNSYKAVYEVAWVLAEAFQAANPSFNAMKFMAAIEGD